jgi:hypothetical protein
MLIPLHRTHHFDDQRFWQRLILVLKRTSSIVQDSLFLFMCEFPSIHYSPIRQGRFLNVLFRDIEFYFSFDPTILTSFFDRINSSLSDILRTFDPELPFVLLHVMKAGIPDSLSLVLIPIMREILLTVRDRQIIRRWTRIVLSVSDWNLRLQTEFPFDMLLELEPSVSILQTALFDVLSNLILQSDSEFFSITELSLYSIQYDSPTSLTFLKAFVFYSATNPVFIQNTPAVSYTFSRLATVEEVWHCAFCILSGQQFTPGFPQAVSIARPSFVGVILQMANALCRREVLTLLHGHDAPHIQLITIVFKTLLSTPFDQFPLFALPEHRLCLVILLNCGLVPESAFSPESEERIICRWNQLPPVSLTEE